MLFCITAEYSAQALNAMRENPSNRQESVEKLIEAAGGKLVAMYGTVRNGPGVMIILDVNDPSSAPSITGVIKSTGAAENVHLFRLATMEEVTGFRQKAAQIRGSYKAPGQ